PALPGGHAHADRAGRGRAAAAAVAGPDPRVGDRTRAGDALAGSGGRAPLAGEHHAGGAGGAARVQRRPGALAGRRDRDDALADRTAAAETGFGADAPGRGRLKAAAETPRSLHGGFGPPPLVAPPPRGATRVPGTDRSSVGPPRNPGARTAHL